MRSTAHRKSSLEMAVGQGQKSKVKGQNNYIVNRLMGYGFSSGGQKLGSAFSAGVCKTRARSASSSPLLSVLDGKEVCLSR